MKKILIKFALVIFLLVVIIIGIAWAMASTIVRKGVERGASQALGVDTRIDILKVSLINGRLAIDGLAIDSPKGFQTSQLMKSGRFEFQMKPLSLLTETVQLRKFELDGLEVNIEQKLGGNNISPILANLRKPESGAKKQERTAGKRISVERVLIDNVVANIRLPAELGIATPKTIKIPRIELTDVTSDNAKGILFSELIRRLFPVIIAAVVNEGGGILPEDLLKDLKVDVTGLAETLGKGGRELLQQVGGEIEELIRARADQAIKKVEESLGRDVGGALKEVLDKKGFPRKEE